MNGKKIHHLNDRTMKYETLAQTKRQHQYWGLQGEFKTPYPQEIVFPNMESGRLDALYSTNINMLVNLEEETKKPNEKTFEKFGKYVIFISICIPEIYIWQSYVMKILEQKQKS